MSGLAAKVQVDIDQVVEVLYVLAGDRVAGLVRVGHRVEEGVERAFGQLDEGLFGRVLARAAQNGVLQDMRQAGGVGGRGAEGDAKNFVFVLVFQREQFRAGLDVFVEGGEAPDLVEDGWLDVFCSAAVNRWLLAGGV